MKNTFLCIQPLEISSPDLLSMFNCSVNISILEKHSQPLPAWAGHIQGLSSSSYQDMYSLLIPKIDNYSLRMSIHSAFSPFLDLKGTSYYLLFDSTLCCFYLCFEIKFDFSSSPPLHMETLIKKRSPDLYTQMRTLLVKDGESSSVCSWADAVYTEAISTAENILDCVYSLPLASPITIPFSTGNITNFVDLSSYGEIGRKNTYDKLIELNVDVDRFNNSNPKPIPVNDLELYYFGGLFHTISVYYDKNRHLFYSLQFQMQFNWFYSSTLARLCQYTDRVINEKNEIPPYSDMENLIEKILLLKLKNEYYKTSIEKNKDEVYDLIESGWNMEATIDSLSFYVKKYERRVLSGRTALHISNNNLTPLNEKAFLEKINTLTNEKKDLEESAFKDDLTRAFTRKKLYIDIEEHIALHDTSYFLSFIDIDNFKTVNDVYGHQAGDRVLKKMVDIIFSSLKESDASGAVYRLGGDEFILVVFGQDDESFLAILNYVKNRIEQTPVSSDGARISPTVSIGSSKLQEGQGLEDIIGVTDGLLYKAKENGRNRIEYTFGPIS